MYNTTNKAYMYAIMEVSSNNYYCNSHKRFEGLSHNTSVYESVNRAKMVIKTKPDFFTGRLGIDYYIVQMCLYKYE